MAAAKTNCYKANFRGAFLLGTNFNGANLNCTDFSNASLLINNEYETNVDVEYMSDS